MNSRERVIATIRHEPRDRIPVFGWVRANMDRQISGAFGSVDAFEDHYQFDLAHLFGGPPVYDPALQKEIKDLLDLQLNDNVKARIIDRYNTNEYRRSATDIPVRAQLETYFYYKRKLELLQTQKAAGTVPPELKQTENVVSTN